MRWGTGLRKRWSASGKEAAALPFPTTSSLIMDIKLTEGCFATRAWARNALAPLRQWINIRRGPRIRADGTWFLYTTAKTALAGFIAGQALEWRPTVSTSMPLRPAFFGRRDVREELVRQTTQRAAQTVPLGGRVGS